MVQIASRIAEQDIRKAVVARLLADAGSGDRIVEELGVGSARIDVALISGQLSGFEIKSDYDTLDRLARQMHAYHCVFDDLTIVTTAAYALQVEQLLPKWWGIWIAQAHGDASIELQIHRESTRHDRLDALSLAAMLWREEAYRFVVEHLGTVVRPRASRGELQELIAAKLPLELICQEVLRILRDREVLKPRSHVTAGQLPYGENEMVAGGIAAPRHQVA